MDEHVPIKQPEKLNAEMRCGILSNAKGEILIIHDKPIRSDIQWVEYNPDEKTFFLIHMDGTSQDLGLEFDQKMIENLKHGTEVALAQIADGKMQSSQKTTLIIQDY